MKIKAAARKALIAADPHYYSWDPELQERFRATMDEAAEKRVDAVLLKELLGIQCSPENVNEIWNDVPLSKRDDLNWAKLLTTGIGEDRVFLNEAMAENTSLFDFETLYEYDFDNHLFQEHEYKKEDQAFPGREYYALRFSCWARLVIDGRFYYATLYSLAGYLTERMDDQGFDIIQTLIPHDYVEGKHHGKPEKGGFRWDMQLEAGGLEKQFYELIERWHHYMQQRWLDLSKTFFQENSAVFMVDVEQDGELQRHFIFNNERALKQVRWRHFLKDCEQLKADFPTVAELEQQELATMEHWLRETHKDILENFDPNVVKLRKKRKVVVAPGAFDGLTDIDNDE